MQTFPPTWWTEEDFPKRPKDKWLGEPYPFVWETGEFSGTENVVGETEDGFQVFQRLKEENDEASKAASKASEDGDNEAASKPKPRREPKREPRREPRRKRYYVGTYYVRKDEGVLKSKFGNRYLQPSFYANKPVPRATKTKTKTEAYDMPQFDYETLRIPSDIVNYVSKREEAQLDRLQARSAEALAVRRDIKKRLDDKHALYVSELTKEVETLREYFNKGEVKLGFHVTKWNWETFLQNIPTKKKQSYDTTLEWIRYVNSQPYDVKAFLREKELSDDAVMAKSFYDELLSMVLRKERNFNRLKRTYNADETMREEKENALREDDTQKLKDWYGIDFNGKFTDAGFTQLLRVWDAIQNDIFTDENGNYAITSLNIKIFWPQPSKNAKGMLLGKYPLQTENLDKLEIAQGVTLQSLPAWSSTGADIIELQTKKVDEFIQKDIFNKIMKLEKLETLKTKGLRKLKLNEKSVNGAKTWVTNSYKLVSLLNTNVRESVKNLEDIKKENYDDVVESLNNFFTNYDDINRAGMTYDMDTALQTIANTTKPLHLIVIVGDAPRLNGVDILMKKYGNAKDQLDPLELLNMRTLITKSLTEDIKFRAKVDEAVDEYINLFPDAEDFEQDDELNNEKDYGKKLATLQQLWESRKNEYNPRGWFWRKKTVDSASFKKFEIARKKVEQIKYETPDDGEYLALLEKFYIFGILPEKFNSTDEINSDVRFIKPRIKALKERKQAMNSYYEIMSCEKDIEVLLENYKLVGENLKDNEQIMNDATLHLADCIVTQLVETPETRVPGNIQKTKENLGKIYLAYEKYKGFQGKAKLIDEILDSSESESLKTKISEILLDERDQMLDALLKGCENSVVRENNEWKDGFLNVETMSGVWKKVYTQHNEKLKKFLEKNNLEVTEMSRKAALKQIKTQKKNKEKEAAETLLGEIESLEYAEAMQAFKAMVGKFPDNIGKGWKKNKEKRFENGGLRTFVKEENDDKIIELLTELRKGDTLPGKLRLIGDMIQGKAKPPAPTKAATVAKTPAPAATAAKAPAPAPAKAPAKAPAQAAKTPAPAETLEGIVNLIDREMKQISDLDKVVQNVYARLKNKEVFNKHPNLEFARKIIGENKDFRKDDATNEKLEYVKIMDEDPDTYKGLASFTTSYSIESELPTLLSEYRTEKEEVLKGEVEDIVLKDIENIERMGDFKFTRQYFANKYADILKNEEPYTKLQSYRGPADMVPNLAAENDVFFRRRGPGGLLALLKSIRQVPRLNTVKEDYSMVKRAFKNLYQDEGLDWWLLDVYLNLENISA